MWILGDGQSINFWYSNCIEDSPLVNKINSNMIHFIEENAKISDFITFTKHWDTNSLTHVHPDRIVNKIKQSQSLNLISKTE